MEAGAGRLYLAPRAPRSPATPNRAGDTAASVSPSPAPRARGPRPAKSERSKTKSARAVKSQGLTKPFVGCRDSLGLGLPALSGSPGQSAGPLAAGGVGHRTRALAQWAARRCGNAACSPARSTLHPPGHGPERLQDRQRVGAGNYKSNPSSRGVKLQRKRTSQGKKGACT